MSVAESRYEVLKEVSLQTNFKTTNDPNENMWDLYWTDMAV